MSRHAVWASVSKTHKSRVAFLRWVVHSTDVALFLDASLVGFRALSPPCLTGSAARSLRS
eukprot:15256106-Ditylum_brightwellii.AAC.1